MKRDIYLNNSIYFPACYKICSLEEPKKLFFVEKE